MAEGAISFPGIPDPRFLIGVRTLGTRPDVFQIFATPSDESPDTSGLATLMFGFGDNVITVQNALCDRGSLVISHGGHYQQFAILDRRWMWSRVFYTRAYNVTYPDGSIDPTTTATLAQIAADIFTQMGETAVDLSAIDSTESPYVVYDYDCCADALDELLTKRGYVVSLMPDDSVCVFKRGFGNALPNNDEVASVAISLDPPEIPYALTAVGKKTMVQSRLKMVPVGQDTDGSIKSVNDLSYKPSDGWDDKDLKTMDFITDPTAKDLAKQTVGKWYQVQSQGDGTFVIPGYNPAQFEVTSAFQYLPLTDKLLSVTSDIYGKYDAVPAYVEGTFLQTVVDSNPPKDKNSDDFSRMDHRDWKLIPKLGIVEFAELALKRNPGPVSGAMTFADVYLTCSYSVHPNTTRVKDRGTWSWILGGIGEDKESVPAVQRQIICSYSGATLAGVSDNRESMARIANTYLSQAAAKYSTNVGSVVAYRGIWPINTDGIALQVRWDVAVPHQPIPFQTSVTQYCEGLPQLPTTRERVLIRRANLLADPNAERTRRYERIMSKLDDE